MYFDKRYLQFNDLVFDGYDMISDYDEPLQYKGSSTPISYGHGSYRAFKSDFLYVSERQVNMTITLKLKKIPCEYREFYVQFAEQEFGKPGKLWAIKNNEIIWANAAVNNIRPVHNGKKYEVVYDIEFVIPGGVWHKAHQDRTFLLPYDVCSLMDCKGFEKFSDCNCCPVCDDKNLYKSMRDRCGCCCDEDLTSDMMLCKHLDELQAFYGCDTPYQLVYSCEAGERLSEEKAFGQRLCVADICEESVISGQIYSNTDIPTDDVTVTLVGHMVNPLIRINGNENIIEGEYHGVLTIKPNGDIYYKDADGCGEELLSPLLDDGVTPRWTIPSGMDYGWTIYPQLNGVVVYTNVCCSQYGRNCVYIDHQPITT